MAPLQTTLTGFIDRLGPPFFGLVGRIAEGLGRALPLLEPVFELMLRGADVILDRLEPGLRTLQPHLPQLTEAADEFFAALADLVPELVELAIALVPLAADMLRVAGVMGGVGIRAVVGFLVVVTDLLNTVRPLRTLVAGLLVVLLAYKTVNSVVAPILTLTRALWGLAAASGAVGAAQAGGAAAGGGSLLTKILSGGGALGSLGRLGGVAGLAALNAYLGYRLVKGVATNEGQARDRLLGRAPLLNPLDPKPSTRPTASSAPPSPRGAGSVGGMSVNGPLVNVENATADVDVERAVFAALDRYWREQAERGGRLPAGVR
jgi:hypothetical protein